jgi:hypothetical protein
MFMQPVKESIVMEPVQQALVMQPAEDKLDEGDEEVMYRPDDSQSFLNPVSEEDTSQMAQHMKNLNRN